MARAALRIKVTSKDGKALQMLLSGGVRRVRVVLRALALLQLAKGVSAPQIAGMVPLTAQAIRKIGHRYRNGGLERALYEKQRPGAEALLEESSEKRRIIAMVCSFPITGGFARWTVRLVAEEAVKRRLVPRVGRSFVFCSSATTSSVAEKLSCVAELNEDYIAKMEDILEVYGQRPYDPEKPWSQHRRETDHAARRWRASYSPVKPGREARQDNEYKHRLADQRYLRR